MVVVVKEVKTAQIFTGVKFPFVVLYSIKQLSLNLFELNLLKDSVSRHFIPRKPTQPNPKKAPKERPPHTADQAQIRGSTPRNSEPGRQPNDIPTPTYRQHIQTRATKTEQNSSNSCNRKETCYGQNGDLLVNYFSW